MGAWLVRVKPSRKAKGAFWLGRHALRVMANSLAGAVAMA